MKTEDITEGKKKELLMWVLKNIPVHAFNAAIKQYSHQRIYGYNKNIMISEFKDVFEGSKLWFSVIMSDVFKPYKVDDVACQERDFKMNKIKRYYSLLPKFHPKKEELRNEFNALVNEHNKAIEPQNKLIKLYLYFHFTSKEMKNENLEEIKDRIAKNDGFENWISMTWQVNHTSYGLMWQKVANEILKENQELKARIEELEIEIKVLQQFDER